VAIKLISGINRRYRWSTYAMYRI